MNTFQDFGLPESLNHTLLHMEFNTPTPIQQKAIPVALQGKDILGSAQTGTGKTGAFGIPLVARLLINPDGTALVMTPTRELATQVMKQLHAMMGKKSKIKTALLIGGESMPKQLSQLRNNPRLVVGTPGRINDHLNRRSLKLDCTDFLVLDETDRMLDMGFSVQIEEIMEYMCPVRQTLLFSATLPKNIVKIAQRYLNDPEHISVNPTSSPATNIKQENIEVSDDNKFSHLLSELDTRTGSVIIFVKTKYGTEKLARKLEKKGHKASCIHGDLKQNKRDKVIAGFHAKKYRILVATDVAARGLDIPHIEHVINYDLPQCPEDYIHRIGRTARAGAKGKALNLISTKDAGKWIAIERLLDPNAKQDSAPQRPSRNRRRKPAHNRKSIKPNTGKNAHKKQENKDSHNKKPAKTKSLKSSLKKQDAKQTQKKPSKKNMRSKKANDTPKRKRYTF